MESLTTAAPLQELMSVADAAVALGCSPATVWRLVRAGRLERRRLRGRTLFSASDVAALVAMRGAVEVRK